MSSSIPYSKDFGVLEDEAFKDVCKFLGKKLSAKLYYYKCRYYVDDIPLLYNCSNSERKRVLEKVKTELEAKGWQVKQLSVSRFGGKNTSFKYHVEPMEQKMTR